MDAAGESKNLHGPGFVLRNAADCTWQGAEGSDAGALFEVQHWILQRTDALHSNLDGVSRL